MSTLDLREISRCFQGVVPSIMATCGREGTPNITYLSYVHLVDEKHVAVSNQFFNKTLRNVLENPRAQVEVYDPLTMAAYRLRLRFLRKESEGPLFDLMSTRIEAIASHTGMKGVFRLLNAGVYEVTSAERVEGFLEAHEVMPAVEPRRGALTELRLLQVVSARLNRAHTLDEMLTVTLEALDEQGGFRHSMVLLADETGSRLQTIASHGYGGAGVGAEVAVGEGILGVVAEKKQVARIGAIDSELRYGRAIREQAKAGGAAISREIPLPGLPDSRSQLAIPLLARDRLVGVLAVESRDPFAFQDWHEAFLEVLAGQIALGIERLSQVDEDEADEEAGLACPAPAATARTRSFCFYRNDDCVFVDGEYLIRNVPGKILWKILTQFEKKGRVEFTNRELRLDPSLGLPPVKDNLEARLILLRKRLAEKCPDVRLVPVRRGRFALQVDCRLALTERDAA